jgi:hypothetical protein
MTSHDIAKALEVWTLQNLYNISILLGILALGLALIQQYYKALERRLTLRVSTEVWAVLTIAVVDILLIAVVVVGFLVLNPDIMADIKIAIPFGPIATVLFTIALLVRLFHGGHELGSKPFMRAVWLMLVGNIIAIVGFTFVMEAPAGAYLEAHPSGFWTFLKTHLRSNANLELAQVTFLIFFPLLMVVFGWGFRSALRQLKRGANG